MKKILLVFSISLYYNYSFTIERKEESINTISLHNEEENMNIITIDKEEENILEKTEIKNFFIKHNIEPSCNLNEKTREYLIEENTKFRNAMFSFVKNQKKKTAMYKKNQNDNNKKNRTLSDTIQVLTREKEGLVKENQYLENIMRVRTESLKKKRDTDNTFKEELEILKEHNGIQECIVDSLRLALEQTNLQLEKQQNINRLLEEELRKCKVENKNPQDTVEEFKEEEEANQ